MTIEQRIAAVRELIPCPFCSSSMAEAHLDEPMYKVAWWRVRCSGCGVQSSVFRTKQAAEEFWNKRGGGDVA